MRMINKPGKFFLATLLLFPLPLLAQDGGEPQLTEEVPTEEVKKTFEELGLAPKFRVTAFTDREDDLNCDPIHARYGYCIEQVDFVDFEPPWLLATDFENAQLPDSLRAKLLYFYPGYYGKWQRMESSEQAQIINDSHARLKSYGDLFAQLWESLSYRWAQSDDLTVPVLLKEGYKTVPTAMYAWDSLTTVNRKKFSVPERANWLDGYSWVEPILPVLPVGDPVFSVLEKSPAFFRLAKYAIPEQHFVEPTPVTLLKGRFALRLGFDGRLHDYDFMDGDPRTSGPFFEQIHPYSTVLELDDEAHIPLREFRYPNIQNVQDPSKIKNVIPITSLSDMALKARTQFNQFYRLVATQVMMFSMQEYTVNHMRIMGTLTLMRTPPGAVANASGIARSMNASAQGQTDPTAKQENLINKEAYSVQGGFKLNYREIPEALIVEWLNRLAEPEPVRIFRNDFTTLVTTVLGDLISSDTPTFFEGITDDDLKKWVKENHKEGVELNVLLTELRYMAIREVMSKMNSNDRDMEETWLLLDHLNYEIAVNLDDQPGVKIPPQTFSGLTSGKWESVLGSHYYSTSFIEQGLGAIDPTAVCTTKDRLEALGEPTIGAIFIDQLFVGEDFMEKDRKTGQYTKKRKKSVTNDSLLWNARAKLPFLMIDNPDANKPTINRLIALPGDKAIYRARWKIWSGWHLVWGTELFAGKERLTLRTTAICEDLVLAHPDLVPTLVRASLLDGKFFPTDPLEPSDLVDRTDYPTAPKLAKKRRDLQKDQTKLKGNERSTTLRKIGQATADVAKGQRDLDALEARLEDPKLTEAEINKAASADLGRRGLGLSTDRRQKYQIVPEEVEVSQTVEYFRGLVRPKLEALSAKEKGLIVAVFDSSVPQPWSPLRDFLALTPYARTQNFSSWNRIIKTSGWMLFFDKKETSKQVTLVSPSYRPSEEYAIEHPMPTFHRNRTSDVVFAFDIGGFPYRKSTYTCNEQVNELASSFVAQCDPTVSYSDINEGFSFGFSSYRTTWFRDEPRFGYELGLEMHLDLQKGGYSNLYHEPYPGIDSVVSTLEGSNYQSSGSASPFYAWSFRPQTGASVGFRHMLDPFPLQRILSRAAPWGADGTTGSSILSRYEWGIRGGFLLGPGFNGMEATLVTDLWFARSIRSDYSDWANFTAYHPILNGGIFLRYQRGFLMVNDEDEDRLYKLSSSDTIVLGWRSHFRLPQPRPE